MSCTDDGVPGLVVISNTALVLPFGSLSIVLASCVNATIRFIKYSENLRCGASVLLMPSTLAIPKTLCRILVKKP